ncbi:penicillin-binding transpeptidase domain-containing protein [Corynebacterium sp. sy017]|uniref:penicillin-binding transpeptidase domain-containing protein n=1 Tax=unclassified Corynebacterium TaxID=2624378 RepID=UPI00118562A9|nr:MULTISPECIES: penicillin-binding transpeptidase domain-containing protein [unclassified Corynebacterium]MBP3087847.1 penicillin-binding transpeptidase domain-containing protein [Corynebacterium sp. sy017]TSD92390.1 penicillin-binding transpeptidase domain-containing protein [Corynebacterium sp. SY003]
MKRILSLVFAVIFFIVSVAGLAGCTPKQASAQPIVEKFLSSISGQNFDQAAQLTDADTHVSQLLRRSWDGLQATSLGTHLDSLDTKGTIAVAHYSMKWALPKERTLEYQTSMTLNRLNGEWIIRWQPTALHPDLSANQHLELRPINATKARVISSDGADVLVPGAEYRVIVDLAQVSDRDYVARKIATAVNSAHERDNSVPTVVPQELSNTLKNASGTYSVMTINEIQGSLIEEELSGIPGISFNREATMVETDPGFAPDIVSRVSSLVDEKLDGKNGWQIAAVTTDGAVVNTIEKQEPEVAPAIEISLDHNVQQAAEEAVNVRADMQTMMVAIRPSTGQILAVAQTDKADKSGDLALTGLFPPGSTFKIITAQAGMQEQNLSPDSIVPCPGSMNIYGRVVNNYNGFSLGNVPLESAFARSCNTTFADISTKLERGQLQDIASEFGIGVDYVVPGLNTVTGSVPAGDTELEKTEAGYGQGLDLVSPFGMALVSATAASGKTPVPTLVSGYNTEQDKHPIAPKPEVLDQVRRMMRSVVTSGTAAGMKAGGEIYGKTGEAEINEGSHAWFTGYREDIAFATLIVLGGGSETAVAVTDKFFQRLDELNSARHPE